MVDVDVTTTGEVDALEATSLIPLRLDDLLGADLGSAIDEDSLPWAKLGDLLGGDVHHRLDDGALGGQDDDFIVDIVEGRTYAVGVTHSVGLAATRLTAHDEAPVPEGSTLAQDVRQVDTLLDVVGDIHAREAVGTALIEETLDLTV